LVVFLCSPIKKRRPGGFSLLSGQQTAKLGLCVVADSSRVKLSRIRAM